MLNAVNINLIAFNAFWQDALLQGQLFALFVITVAAAEVGVGLAIVLLIFRNRETVNLEDLQEMGDNPQSRRAPLSITPTGTTVSPTSVVDRETVR
jgi:NADH-quinone oxidoreductase subunit K